MVEGRKMRKKRSIYIRRPLEDGEGGNEVQEVDEQKGRREEEEEEKVEGGRDIVEESNKSFFFGTWHFLCASSKGLLH